MFMSNEKLLEIFDTLIEIKEFCIGQSSCCIECPFRESPLCGMVKPCEWNINNPSKPIFKFF